MRHKKKSEKFSRSRAQRKALTKSLLRSLILSYRIKTTKSKAKAIRTQMDKLISLAKRNDVHSRRLAYTRLGDHAVVKRLFTDVAGHFVNTNAGYTKVINLGYRKGDGAPLAFVELTRIERPQKIKKKKRRVPGKEESQPAAKEKKHPESKGKKPAKSFAEGVRKIFKKERDAL